MLHLSLALTLALSQFDGGEMKTSPNVESSSDAGVDGGTPKPFSHAIYGSCPDAEGAAPAFHTVVEVDGGSLGAWVLPDPRGPRTACLLAACEEDRRYRQSPEAKTPAWVWWVTVAADVVIKGGIAIATWGITKAANASP